MRNHHQVFTVFGGTFISESHGAGLPSEANRGSAGKITALLGALLIGFTTAAAATAKSKSSYAGYYAVPTYHAPAFISKLPGSYGFEEALF